MEGESQGGNLLTIKRYVALVLDSAEGASITNAVIVLELILGLEDSLAKRLARDIAIRDRGRE